MKTLFRWSATLALMGGVLFGSVVGAPKAFALTDEQVMTQLAAVPVFTLADGQGSLVVATFTQEQGGEAKPPVATVFVSHQSAETFLQNMRNNNTELAEGVRVVPISLARVYELAMSGQSQENPLQVAFVPVQADVDAALSILKENGQTIERFPGVPLFLAKSGSGDNESLLTIRRGDQEVIPMYFSEDELQAAIDQLRQNQPDLASSVRIDVVSLGNLLENLRTSDNQELTRIFLIPPEETLNYIRSMQQQEGGQNQQQNQQQSAPQQQQQ